jgi:hypothetical protein
MGKEARFIALAIAGAWLASCQPDAPKPVRKSDAGAPAPTATATAASSPAAPNVPLRDWLVGTWSFETSCATDFLARYGADGSLDNSGEVGSWAFDGETVTETIRERPDEGGEVPVTVNPPETRAYTVARVDQNHGTITYQGRKVPMLRC